MRRALRGLTPGLLLLCGLGCSRQEDVRVYKAPKEDASTASDMTAPAGKGMPEGLPAGSGAPARDAPDARGAEGLTWTAPGGWTSAPGSGMRVATFRIPGDAGGSELSVVSLPGEAGGLLANVNRWRGQIGLDAMDEAGLRKASSTVLSKAGEIVVVDFAGAGEPKPRVLGGVLSRGGTTWFFKLTGPDRTASGAKPAFMEFLRSVRPG